MNPLALSRSPSLLTGSTLNPDQFVSSRLDSISNSRSFPEKIRLTADIINSKSDNLSPKQRSDLNSVVKSILESPQLSTWSDHFSSALTDLKNYAIEQGISLKPQENVYASVIPSEGGVNSSALKDAQLAAQEKSIRLGNQPPLPPRLPSLLGESGKHNLEELPGFSQEERARMVSETGAQQIGCGEDLNMTCDSKGRLTSLVTIEGKSLKFPLNHISTNLPKIAFTKSNMKNMRALSEQLTLNKGDITFRIAFNKEVGKNQIVGLYKDEAGKLITVSLHDSKGNLIPISTHEKNLSIPADVKANLLAAIKDFQTHAPAPPPRASDSLPEPVYGNVIKENPYEVPTLLREESPYRSRQAVDTDPRTIYASLTQNPPENLPEVVFEKPKEPVSNVGQTSTGKAKIPFKDDPNKLFVFTTKNEPGKDPIPVLRYKIDGKVMPSITLETAGTLSYEQMNSLPKNIQDAINGYIDVEDSIYQNVARPESPYGNTGFPSGG